MQQTTTIAQLLLLLLLAHRPTDRTKLSCWGRGQATRANMPAHWRPCDAGLDVMTIVISFEFAPFARQPTSSSSSSSLCPNSWLAGWLNAGGRRRTVISLGRLEVARGQFELGRAI